MYNQSMTTILIIEDEPELVKVLRSYLEKGGYKVLTAYKGDTGLALWESNKPDLVILDLNLPGMDGLDIARAIRKQADTPIIMVTARVEEADRLVGLELGADDYVTKPYSPREVVARVRAVLRRVDQPRERIKLIQVADLEIDLDGYSVKRFNPNRIPSTFNPR
jgi:two-component system alkaline phosphatase synthesis response regulator PhoP